MRVERAVRTSTSVYNKFMSELQTFLASSPLAFYKALQPLDLFGYGALHRSQCMPAQMYGGNGRNLLDEESSAAANAAAQEALAIRAMSLFDAISPLPSLSSSSTNGGGSGDESTGLSFGGMYSSSSSMHSDRASSFSSRASITNGDVLDSNMMTDKSNNNNNATSSFASLLSLHSAGDRESLIRVLLQVGPIQIPLLELLANHLAEAYNALEALEEDQATADFSSSSTSSSSPSSLSERLITQALPRLILAHLKQVEYAVPESGPQLCERLVDITTVLSTSAQREVLATLPFVIDEPSRAPVVTRLLQLLHETPDLATLILDVLTSMSIPSRLRNDVVNAALKLIASTSPITIPLASKVALSVAPVTELSRVLRYVTDLQ